MIASNLTPFDRKILTIAIFFLLMFSYLLYDDHLIMGWVSAQGPKVARILKTKNEVRLKYAQDFRWTNVRHGDIHMGDSIFTGPGSEVTLVLNDDTVVHIEENSLIVLNTSGAQVSLVLKQGHVNGDLENIKIQEVQEKRKPATVTQVVAQRPVITMPKAFEKKEIQVAPDGTWNARPTAEIHWSFDKPNSKFQLQIASDQSFSQMEHTELTQEKTFLSPELKAGTHFIRVREIEEKNSRVLWSKVAHLEISFASPKISVSLLAPAYKRENIAQAINDKQPISIEWYPVSGAKSYMAEVSSDSEMKKSKIVSTDKNQLLISEYAPGKMFFRVTAIGPNKEMGPKGKIGSATIGVNPPQLTRTADQEHLARSGDEKPPVKEFKTRWESVPTVSKYQWQISDHADFNNVKPVDVSATQNLEKISTPGKYYWRVRAMDKNGQPLSGYSDIGTFKYNWGQPLAAPQLLEPAEDMTLFFQQNMETPFYMTWAEPVVPGDYVLEVSTDAQFKKVVFTKTSKATKYLINNTLPKGDLYWHVKVVSGDRESGWSSPRKLTVLSGRAAGGN